MAEAARKESFALLTSHLTIPLVMDANLRLLFLSGLIPTARPRVEVTNRLVGTGACVLKERAGLTCSSHLQCISFSKLRCRLALRHGWKIYVFLTILWINCPAELGFATQA